MVGSSVNKFVCLSLQRHRFGFSPAFPISPCTTIFEQTRSKHSAAAIKCFANRFYERKETMQTIKDWKSSKIQFWQFVESASIVICTRLSNPRLMFQFWSFHELSCWFSWQLCLQSLSELTILSEFVHKTVFINSRSYTFFEIFELFGESDIPSAVKLGSSNKINRWGMAGTQGLFTFF